MVKKLLYSAVFGFALLVPGLVKAEEIVSFDVGIRIEQNGRVQISEKIQYDFGKNLRHGIFRNIPYKYKNKVGNYTIGLDDIAVTDGSGEKLKFKTSKENGEVVLKIGDPDAYITGVHTYVINYTVEGAINFFDTEDELYWNVTGNNWSVPINSATAQIYLPNTVSVETIKLACYAGALGTANWCEQLQVGNPALVGQKNLQAEQGLTMAISFPKGIVREPTAQEKAMRTLQDNFLFFLPLLVLLILFFVWKKYGRDPKGRGVIVTQFEAPDDLTPAEVGTVFDYKAHNKDISAEIIQLAVRGYLKINRMEKKGIIRNTIDYELVQLKPAKDLQRTYQKTLLATLFGNDENTINKNTVLISSFKKDTKVYVEVQNVIRQVYQGLVAAGYFKSNPSTIRWVFVLIGFFIIGLGILLATLASVVGFAVSGLLILIFGFFMPALTQKGMAVKEHILGLKTYLQVAEKARLEFHNAPEKNPEQFEKLLPFAIVLGAEQQWAKQFEHIYVSPPSWYGDTTFNNFTAIALVNGLGDFRSNVHSTFISPSSSAAKGGSGISGGFSGGGFGGGGGGSW